MNAKESIEIEQSARFIEFGNHIVSHSNFITKHELSLYPKIVSFTLDKKLIITSRDYDFKSFKETSKNLTLS